jgi:hypothetical protein
MDREKNAPVPQGSDTKGKSKHPKNDPIESKRLPEESRISLVVFGWEFSVQFMARLLASVAVAGLTALWFWASAQPWAKTHLPIVLAIGALNLIALTVAAFVIMRITRRKQKELLWYKAIANTCGIEGFHPLTTPEEKKSGWGALVDKLGAALDGELCLAVITGASTFACESQQGEENRRSPLRDAIDNHQGELRILLMQKGCEAWKQCIKEFGKGDPTYEDMFRAELEGGFRNAVRFCAALAGKSETKLRSIEVREYDRAPLWKMILVKKYIWVQYYIPGERVDDRPAYMVSRAMRGGLAHPLENVFDYRWRISKDNVLVRRRHEEQVFLSTRALEEMRSE